MAAVDMRAVAGAAAGAVLCSMQFVLIFVQFYLWAMLSFVELISQWFEFVLSPEATLKVPGSSARDVWPWHAAVSWINIPTFTNDPLLPSIRTKCPVPAGGASTSAIGNTGQEPEPSPRKQGEAEVPSNQHASDACDLAVGVDKSGNVDSPGTPIAVHSDAAAAPAIVAPLKASPSKQVPASTALANILKATQYRAQRLKKDFGAPAPSYTLLGRGGGGFTYKGTYGSVAAAFKVLLPSALKKSTVCSEASIALALTHPNVVTTFEVNTALGQSFRAGATAAAGYNAGSISSARARSSHKRSSSSSSSTGSGSSIIEGSITAARRRRRAEAHPTGPCLVIIQELANGGDLKSAIEHGMHCGPKGTLQLEEVLAIVGDIAAGLAYMHSLRVIHADLKSANVVLQRHDAPTATAGSSPAMRAKLIDFGLSFVLPATAAAAARACRERRGAGTTAYMAPELTSYGPSAAADIYALGVILWEMLTGELAQGLFLPTRSGSKTVSTIVFSSDPNYVPSSDKSGAAGGQDGPQTSMMVNPRRLQLSEAAAAALPAGLCALLQRCGADTASERPTAAEVAAELQQIYVALASAAATDNGLPVPEAQPTGVVPTMCAAAAAEGDVAVADVIGDVDLQPAAGGLGPIGSNGTDAIAVVEIQGDWAGKGRVFAEAAAELPALPVLCDEIDCHDVAQIKVGATAADVYGSQTAQHVDWSSLAGDPKPFAGINYAANYGVNDGATFGLGCGLSYGPMRGAVYPGGINGIANGDSQLLGDDGGNVFGGLFVSSTAPRAATAGYCGGVGGVTNQLQPLGFNSFGGLWGAAGPAAAPGGGLFTIGAGSSSVADSVREVIHLPAMATGAVQPPAPLGSGIWGAKATAAAW